jgi:two-component system NarL family sensor kinase
VGYAVLVLAVVALGALCVYLALRERRARRSEERIEILMAKVMEADERSRREIAQTLHDQALQTLLAANQELHDAAPGRVGVTRAHEVVSATIEELREAVSDLHPVTLEQGGLGTALGVMVRRAARQGGFEFDLSVEPGASGVHDELILAIARELLRNAVRHSGAQRVDVAVRVDDGAALLEVDDDGSGIDPGRRDVALREGHIGLASIGYRVDAAGGSFELQAAPGKGTRARARVPLA